MWRPIAFVVVVIVVVVNRIVFDRAAPTETMTVHIIVPIAVVHEGQAVVYHRLHQRETDDEGRLDAMDVDYNHGRLLSQSQEWRQSSSSGKENDYNSERLSRDTPRRPSGCSTSSAPRRTSSHIVINDGTSPVSLHRARPMEMTKPLSRKSDIADSEELVRCHPRHHRHSHSMRSDRPGQYGSLEGVFQIRRMEVFADIVRRQRSRINWLIRSSTSTRIHISNRSNHSSDDSRCHPGIEHHTIISRSAPSFVNGNMDHNKNTTGESAGTQLIVKYPPYVSLLLPEIPPQLAVAHCHSRLC
jgi:hypothetical protein